MSTNSRKKQLARFNDRNSGSTKTPVKNSPTSNTVITKEIRVPEKQITLTMGKMKEMIGEGYDAARKNAAKGAKLYNHYGEFFSIATTTLLTLITSDFKDIGFVSKEAVRNIAWVVFAGTLVIGVILLLIKIINNEAKKTDEIDARNEAIEKICDNVVEENKK